MSDFFPEPEDEGTESRGIPHLLADLARLIQRYSYEYDMSYAEIIGCLSITKQLIIEDVTESAIQSSQDNDENNTEEREQEEVEEDEDIDYE